MDPADVLQQPVLAVAALVLTVVVVAMGVQQVAVRAGDGELTVLVPLVVAAVLAGAVLAAGLQAGRRVASGGRRTPYW